MKGLSDVGRVDCFHPDQVWASPRGTLYRVMACEIGGDALLRVGIEGTGRLVSRPWDAVQGWVIYREAPGGAQSTPEAKLQKTPGPPSVRVHLEVTVEQAQAIKAALDFYSRMAMGQIEEFDFLVRTDVVVPSQECSGLSAGAH